MSARAGEVDLSAPVDATDHADGPADAPVTLVVYGDFECPYTRAAHLAIRRVQATDGATLRYVFRHFPLVEIHPHAANAARAAEAAAAAGRYWPMHDTLFARQDALEDDALIGYAEAEGVSTAAARAALFQGTHDRRIARDIASGQASGVQGTPTLFLGGQRYEGSREAGPLREAVRESAASAR